MPHHGPGDNKCTSKAFCCTSGKKGVFGQIYPA